VSSFFVSYESLKNVELFLLPLNVRRPFLSHERWLLPRIKLQLRGTSRATLVDKIKKHRLVGE
jgi:hypothetical protein